MSSAIMINDQNRLSVKKLRMALDELPAAYDQLWLFVLPRRNPPLDGVRVQGSASTRVPLDLTVLDLLDERIKPGSDLYPSFDLRGRRLGVLPTLSAWVRYVDEELIKEGRQYVPPYRFTACGRACVFISICDVVLPGEAVCSGKRLDHWTKKSVQTESSWLLDQLDFIEDQPWCYKIADPDQPQSISKMLIDIKSIIRDDVASNLKCLNEGCGWEVKPQSNGAWYKCSGCGRAWSWMELRNMAQSRMPITLKEAVERSGTSRSLLLQYIDDGKIEALKIKRGAAKLYDPIQIMSVTMAERYRASPRKSV